MKKLIILLVSIMATKVMAQEDNLRILLNEGNPVEINASDITEITFEDDTEPLDIVGEWFCEAESLGAYESFNFHEDGTINYLYYYINIHSGGATTGTYSFEDYVLKILGDERFKQFYRNKDALYPSDIFLEEMVFFYH